MDNLQILEQQAINAAIKNNWQEAVRLNEQIIKQDKNIVDAYLRLGFAQMQLGNIADAKKWYKKAQKLQPSNYIIKENLERIQILETGKPTTTAGKTVSLDPYLFLETPGKTKTISLVNLGQKNVLAQLTIGQEILLLPKKRKIEIRTKDKEYVGSLPDDISKRLTILMKAGSVFSTHIKSANLNNVIIFIKEEKKGKKVQRYTSFPANIQARLGEISQEEEGHEEETEELSDSDLDRLAEILTTEDKDYLPYEPEEQDEEPEE